MKKQTIQYSSPLDALIAITKRLSQYETQYGMESEYFYHHYNQGKLDDSEAYIEWVNDYCHYLVLHSELAKKLKHAA